MAIKLKDYQQEALLDVQREFSAGITRQLIELPTGSGKTYIIAAVAKHYNKRTLILAHRDELIQQNKEKLKRYWPQADLGICKANRNELDHQIVIGSIQTCSTPKRLAQLKEKGFDILMIDEAHHAASYSYQLLIDALEFHKGKLLLGVTATPMRSDKKELGDTFDKIVFSRSIGTMIAAGHLSPVIGRKILTNFVLKKIRTHMGDFAVGQLAKEINQDERNAFIVSKYQEYASNRKAVAFCADVKHCHDLAAAFNKVGIPAAAIWGSMKYKERKKVLQKLRKGAIKVVTSCGVLTEGFDEPSIEAILMARPTKSKGLYIQCVGRGLRKHEGKINCLVLDFTDKGHNLRSVITLKKAIPEAKYLEEVIPKPLPLVELTDNNLATRLQKEIDKEFDIVGSSNFIWLEIDGEHSLFDDKQNEIVIRPEDNGFVACLYDAQGNVKDLILEPIPLYYCKALCEDYAHKNLTITYANLNGSWAKDSQRVPPTDGQKKYLQQNGIPTWNMNKMDACIAIREIITLKNRERRKNVGNAITEKQKYYLEQKGIDTANMTKSHAMQTIAQLKSTEPDQHGNRA